MGVLSRFKDIMAANINAMLDKCEDPSKMIDQTLRNLRSDLAQVKTETAAVMADEKNAKRKVDECEESIKKFANAARNAVAAGNDDDARELLNTINYSKQIFFDKKDDWSAMMKRAMEQDYSWDQSAKIYEELYSQL